MRFEQRLWTSANMFLVCFFGDLLRLGKFSNTTSIINSKMTLPSLEYWFGVCWSMMEKKTKAQIKFFDNNKEHIITLHEKVTRSHKEMITHQKKLKLF